MELTPSQVESYQENGFLLVPELFNEEEVNDMLEEMGKVVPEDCPRRILEKNGSLRSFFAPETTSELFSRIIKLGRLVNPAVQLLGERVYVHQSKLNVKQAMLGDWWEWHRDYTYWQKDDGMPKPDVLTAMIFLNPVNEFNGPLLLIPGSHRAERLESEVNPIKKGDDGSWFGKYRESESYLSALTSDLKYTLKQRTLEEWAGEKGIWSAKGDKGSVLFFHGNVFHASSNNMSPWNRNSFLITYNSILNTLPDTDQPRPSFLANRDFTPIREEENPVPVF